MKISLRRLGNQGVTVLELLTVVAVIGLSTGTAVSRLNAGSRNIDSANQELIANLRLCRTQATAHGYHCRVNLVSTASYRVERMLPPAIAGGSWTADTSSVRTITLPSSVQLGQSGVTYEFDTRGSVVGRTTAASVSLADSGHNRTLSFQVWPSGQIG